MIAYLFVPHRDDDILSSVIIDYEEEMAEHLIKQTACQWVHRYTIGKI